MIWGVGAFFLGDFFEGFFDSLACAPFLGISSAAYEAEASFAAGADGAPFATEVFDFFLGRPRDELPLQLPFSCHTLASGSDFM